MWKSINFKGMFLSGLIMLFSSGWVMGQTIAQFEFPATNSLTVSVKEANVTVTDVALSSGTISTNYTTGTYFPNEPYIQGTGWTATTQASAKYFYFTITAGSGYNFSITNISFNAYATSAGPSAFGFAIGSSDLYSTNAPSASLLSVDQSVTGQSGLSTATIKIQGWLNSSRASTGGGSFKLDDVIITGTVTALATPFIAIDPSTLDGYTYTEGSGPSSSQSFTLEGRNLTSDITVTPPTNYEISSDNNTFQSTPSLYGESGGEVSTKTVYVRLKTGLAQGDYNGETVTLSSSGATNKTITCSGSVLSTSSVIINEVDADTEGSDILEFIELYDGGAGNTSLNGLVLALYDGGDDLSNVPYDLDGYSTDANGYFVLGDAAVSNVDYTVSNSFIQNGSDAVALYSGDAADFPAGTAVTSANLIDALVYDTDDADDDGLLPLLISGQSQINEAGNGNSARHSNQRLPNGSGGARNTSTYGQYFPTPGTENDDWQTTWTGSGTDWTASGNWSDGVPTTNHDVTIPTGKTPIIAASTLADCYDLTLEGDATLNIVSTSATANGSLIFGGTYTGSATAVTYQRYFVNLKEQMFGSPFSGQVIDGAFLSSNSINGMIHYIESDDAWSVNYTTTLPSSPYNAFAPGTGYMAKRSGNGVINLTGTPNNATVNISLTRSNNGWNFLSNPFTSAIAANANGDATNNLLTVNESVLDASYTALYIWDGSSYKIINHASGTPSVTMDPVQNYLQVGQGFFVRSKSGGGTFSITQAMQSHQTAIPFKSSEETSWASIILNVEMSTSEASTRILYREDMSRGIDIGYDAGLFNSNQDFSLYSRLVEDNGVDFGLQCLPTDFVNLVVPIGLDAKAGEIVKFSVNALNIPEEYAVILEDKTANTFTNLSDETAEYTIQLTNDSEGAGRFFIRTSFKSSLGFDDISKQNAFQVFARAKNHQLVIRGNANENTSARIYSITGKLVTVVGLRQTTENLIPFNEKAGVYIVQITNEVGIQTQKFAWVK